MDSGCVKDGEELDETYDVSRPLEPAEVLGIIDQLLSHEMAWHLGYPLAQTVLTSVYAEALLMPTPSSMRETDFVRTPYSETASSSSATTRHPMLTVLRAYCVGLLKACGMVIEHVISEPYYEVTTPIAFLVIMMDQLKLTPNTRKKTLSPIPATAFSLQTSRSMISDKP